MGSSAVGEIQREGRGKAGVGAVSVGGDGHTGVVFGALSGEERAGAAALWVDGEGGADGAAATFGVEQRPSSSVAEKRLALTTSQELVRNDQKVW
jgi:hypothetical protein